MTLITAFIKMFLIIQMIFHYFSFKIEILYCKYLVQAKIYFIYKFYIYFQNPALSLNYLNLLGLYKFNHSSYLINHGFYLNLAYFGNENNYFD